MTNDLTTEQDDEVSDALVTLLGRQSAALPAGYKPRSAADMTFDPRLAYELALEMDKPLAVFLRYGIEQDTAMEMLKLPQFVATVKKYKAEIVENGIGFKMKAKMQAEDLLTHSYALAVDPLTPPAVRANLIQWTTKVAGLEPVVSKDTGVVGQNEFTLNITFAGQPQTVVNAQRMIEGE